MSLQPGTRLGPYESTAQIGVGGCGRHVRRWSAARRKGEQATSSRWTGSGLFRPDVISTS